MNEMQEKHFEKVAAIAATFGSRARLKIIFVLAQAPRSVEAIAQLTGESVANTSQHLQRLGREGLVVVKKEKVSHIYRLASGTVALLIENLFDLAEEFGLTPAQSKGHQTGPLENAHSFEQALPAILAKTAYLLDVREEYEAQSSAVPGALTIPLGELASKISTLPANATFYLFCRGRVCGMANEGVALLRGHGKKAYCLKESPSIIKQKFRQHHHHGED